jgi:hypothetical protein
MWGLFLINPYANSTIKYFMMICCRYHPNTFSSIAGAGFEPCDLEVMGLAS